MKRSIDIGEEKRETSTNQLKPIHYQEEASYVITAASYIYLCSLGKSLIYSMSLSISKHKPTTATTTKHARLLEKF